MVISIIPFLKKKKCDIICQNISKSISDGNIKQVKQSIQNLIQLKAA